MSAMYASKIRQLLDGDQPTSTPIVTKILKPTRRPSSPPVQHTTDLRPVQVQGARPPTTAPPDVAVSLNANHHLRSSSLHLHLQLVDAGFGKMKLVDTPPATGKMFEASLHAVPVITTVDTGPSSFGPVTAPVDKPLTASNASRSPKDVPKHGLGLSTSSALTQLAALRMQDISVDAYTAHTQSRLSNAAAAKLMPKDKEPRVNILKMTAAERRQYINSIQPETKHRYVDNATSDPCYAKLTITQPSSIGDPIGSNKRESRHESASASQLMKDLKYFGHTVTRIELQFAGSALYFHDGFDSSFPDDPALIRSLAYTSARPEESKHTAILYWEHAMWSRLANVKDELRQLESALADLPKSVKEVRWRDPHAPVWVLRLLEQRMSTVQGELVKRGNGYVRFLVWGTNRYV